MQSSNNDSNLYDSQELPAESSAELKINKRTRGVYEQYLKQTIKSAALEKEGAIEKPHTSNYANTNILTPIQTFDASEGRSSRGTKWLTVVGVFCAVLLIGVIVVILNVTGIIVSLSERLPTVSTQAPAIPIATEVLVGNSNTAVGDSTDVVETVDNANIVNGVNNGNADNDASDNDSLIATNTESMPTTVRTRMRSMSIQNTNVVPEEGNTEPAISFDDFAQEAQIVLYRETTD